MPEQRLHGINFECYNENEGSSRLLGLASIDMPEINFLTNEVKGAGVLGQYDSPVIGHLEALELTFHFRILTKDGIKYLKQKEAWRLTCYGAQQMYDAGLGILRAAQLKVATRGLPKNLNRGKTSICRKSLRRLLGTVARTFIISATSTR